MRLPITKASRCSLFSEILKDSWTHYRPMGGETLAFELPIIPADKYRIGYNSAQRDRLYPIRKVVPRSCLSYDDIRAIAPESKHLWLIWNWIFLRRKPSWGGKSEVSLNILHFLSGMWTFWIVLRLALSCYWRRKIEVLNYYHPFRFSLSFHTFPLYSYVLTYIPMSPCEHVCIYTCTLL